MKRIDNNSSEDNYGPVYAIASTSDGGYLLGRGRKQMEGAGIFTDGWITKIDSNGEKIWEKQMKRIDNNSSEDNYGPVYAICESK